MDETIRMRYGRQGRSSSSSNEIHPPSQTGGQSFNDLPEQLLKREAGNNIEDGVAVADVVPPMDQREDDSIHRDSHEEDLQDVAVSSSGSYSPEKNSSDGMPIHNAGVGASLPSVDELRHMKSPNGKSVQKTSMPSMTRSRIRCIAIGLVVFVILIWILVVAGKGQMNKPKADQIVDFLSKKGVSSWQDLTSDASSPHVQAVQWLDLEVPSVEHELTHSDLHERFIARYILALIYFALSGPTWWNDLGFLTNKDICEWKGLVYSEKDKTSSMQGVVCDGESRLVELNLHGNNMKGELPSELGLLTALTRLDFGNGMVDGGVPSDLCNLSLLTSLDLSENLLRGSIPSCTSWSALEQLAVHQNDFTGSLPTSIGTSMPRLKRLFLSSNVITGDPLSIFNNLTSLELLLGDSNEFAAELDDSFLKHSNALKWLDLSSNDFMLHGRSNKMSSIPWHLLAHSTLEVLDISKNRLMGTLPFGLDNQANVVLKYFSVMDNQLVGDLHHLTHLISLRHLDVSKNMFTGEIPTALADLSHLRLLFLGENHFAPSPVPSNLWRIDHLHDFSMRKTNRTGSFDPTSLPDSLVYCDLGSGQLSGSIPDSVSRLSHLEFLMLNDNNGLKGSIPPSFTKLSHLRAVFLDGTSIDQNVSEICTLPKFVKPNGHEIAFADCAERYDDDSTIAPFQCDCCQCCEHTNHTKYANGCSVPFQQNLRKTWSVDFETLHFTITNATVFLNREYIPPYVKGT